MNSIRGRLCREWEGGVYIEETKRISLYLALTARGAQMDTDADYLDTVAEFYSQILYGRMNSVP